VGAALSLDDLPLVDGLVDDLGEQEGRRAALCGGDDYELLVTLPPEKWDQARQRLTRQGLALRMIGQITTGSGVSGLGDQGRRGWQHFESRPDTGGMP
jgi:thiamine-monophosphate kinase